MELEFTQAAKARTLLGLQIILRHKYINLEITHINHKYLQLGSYVSSWQWEENHCFLLSKPKYQILIFYYSNRKCMIDFGTNLGF